MPKENLASKLYNNRLMKTDKEIENFQQALSLLHASKTIENIVYFCQTFDDKTHEHEVMFSMVHAIEHYDDILGQQVTISTLLDCIHMMMASAPDWLEVLILRHLNNDNAREALVTEVIQKNDAIKTVIKEVIHKLIQRNPEKFKQSGNKVLSRL